MAVDVLTEIEIARPREVVAEFAVGLYEALSANRDLILAYILAERFELGVEEAFHLLRRASRSHRVLLRELAATVVGEPETPPEILSALKRVR